MNSHQRRKFRRRNNIIRVNFIFISGGNDSVSLMQWAKEHFPNDRNIVIYSNTGWAAEFWKVRMEKVEAFSRKIGFEFAVTKSEGMEKLVKRKKGWPMPASKYQFCTQELKIIPALNWMDKNEPSDLPHFRNRCFTGIRREESKNRENTPEYVGYSEKHGGRKLRCPLVELKVDKRNELINKTGLEILPHQSRECFPCVCSNRSDFRMLAGYPERIEKIARIEKEMGFTSKNKPRVMFRPYRHMGATGIKEVVKWGLSERGKYGKETLPCSSGFCGI